MKYKSLGLILSVLLSNTVHADMLSHFVNEIKVDAGMPAGTGYVNAIYLGGAVQLYPHEKTERYNSIQLTSGTINVYSTQTMALPDSCKILVYTGSTIHFQGTLKAGSQPVLYCTLTG